METLEKNIEDGNNLEEINLQETKENQKLDYTKEVNLLSDYSLYLDHFGRSNFSPSMIKNRYITIKKENVVFFISYAQLNFFKWIIKVGLYQYIENNKENLMEEFQEFKTKKNNNQQTFNNQQKFNNQVLQSTSVAAKKTN